MDPRLQIAPRLYTPRGSMIGVLHNVMAPAITSAPVRVHLTRRLSTIPKNSQPTICYTDNPPWPHNNRILACDETDKTHCALCSNVNEYHAEQNTTSQHPAWSPTYRPLAWITLHSTVPSFPLNLKLENDNQAPTNTPQHNTPHRRYYRPFPTQYTHFFPRSTHQ